MSEIAAQRGVVIGSASRIGWAVAKGLADGVLEDYIERTHVDRMACL
ncbi:hypothetical protein [Mycolicibacterium helvum]|uniref:Uncharacterized protein n=1 Tax=Mycolicibacterium helvum TaxID=1534349 RepID=A0A7I7T620_9MYCO|nr:hypothetical protein [Mycolicibacterium helvum]BBY64724.1 hypothetical protein MHEL_29670 [Mycolicibacterium helvum]